MSYNTKETTVTAGARNFIHASQLLAEQKETIVSDISSSSYHASNSSLYFVVSRAVRKEIQQPISIGVINGISLKSPISAVLENDGDGFIARCVDLPIFGYGDDQFESINALKHELHSLYEDLIESDDFTDEWLNYKKYLTALFNG